MEEGCPQGAAWILARGGKGDLGSHLPPAAGTKLHRGQPLTAGTPAPKQDKQRSAMQIKGQHAF